jgi:hypothetical protein
MLTWIVLQLPLALVPAPAPPPCQLEVLPPFVIEERTVLSDFNTRIDDYVRLQRRLKRALPEHVFADSEDWAEATEALHTVLVQARPDARPGAIFTPAIAAVLTARLERAVASLGPAPAKIAMSMRLGYMAGLPEPQVNGHFPALRYSHAWPALVAALPELPPELQYRFVDRDLVLVDTQADLVVDILKEALPDPYAGLVSDFAPVRKTSQGIAETRSVNGKFAEESV